MKRKPILSKLEIKLLKVMFFVGCVISYGLLIKAFKVSLASFIFGILLYLYIKEIYGGVKK